MTDKLKFDAKGNPEDMPPEVRKSIWTGAALMASNYNRLVQTIVDKGTSGSRKCPKCEATIPWDGDPQVAKYGLDLMSKLMQLFGRKSGDIEPGNLEALLDDLDDQAKDDLLELALAQREKRKLRKAGPARNSASETHQEPLEVEVD